MAFANPEDAEIAQLLRAGKTIALVGASANEERPAFRVGTYLAGLNYDVYGINPGLAGQQLYGNPVYAKLAEVPAPVDMVDVFRNSEAAGGVVDEALALIPLPKLIWMQLNVFNEEAAARARAKGVAVVMNRCPKIEIPRLGL